MASNNTLVFKKIPDGLPISGEHLVVEDRPIDLDNVPSGGLVMEVHSASLDPYLRTRMRDPEVPSFMTAFKINDPIVNGCVGTVLKSSTPDFVKGDLIYVPFLPLAQYACVSAEDIKTAQKIDNPFNLPLENFVGPLGMPGLTAYSSLYEIGKPQKGETIFVSSAAGAVGSLVGQLAKREGLRVIGSVGSDEKLDFILNDLGFDAGFNYKKESPSNALKRLAPDGIHIYFENVGGKHLEAAIESLKDRGRVIVCGMVETYNTPMEKRYGVRNLVEIFVKRLTIRGFVVGDEDFGPAYTSEHQANVQRWIADGSMKGKLHVTRGLENATEAFVELFQGKNFGKAVLRIKE